jgi:hypothetical protein
VLRTRVHGFGVVLSSFRVACASINRNLQLLGLS